MDPQGKDFTGRSGLGSLNVLGGSGNPLGGLGQILSSKPTEGGRGLRFAFAMLGLAAAVVGSIYAYDRSSSWALVLFVFLWTWGTVSRFAQVILRDKKIRRTLYYLLLPGISAGVLYLSYEWWDRWWLAVILGFVVGGILGIIITTLLFPGIAREERESNREAQREFRSQLS